MFGLAEASETELGALFEGSYTSFAGSFLRFKYIVGATELGGRCGLSFGAEFSRRWLGRAAAGLSFISKLMAPGEKELDCDLGGGGGFLYTSDKGWSVFAAGENLVLEGTLGGGGAFSNTWETRSPARSVRFGENGASFWVGGGGGTLS